MKNKYLILIVAAIIMVIFVLFAVFYDLPSSPAYRCNPIFDPPLESIGNNPSLKSQCEAMTGCVWADVGNTCSPDYQTWYRCCPKEIIENYSKYCYKPTNYAEVCIRCTKWKMFCGGDLP